MWAAHIYRHRWLLGLSVLCFTPFLLNGFGLDFSSQTLLNNAALDPQEQAFISLRGPLHHVILEWSAVLVALLAAVVSGLHYRLRQDISIGIIGVALLSAALVDGFHILAATRIIQGSAPNGDFIPFTWALSRVFNGAILICAILASMWFSSRERWLSEAKRAHYMLAVLGLLFLLLAYLSVSFAAYSDLLPKTIYPSALITRPFDVLPLALFLLAGILSWGWLAQHSTVFKYGLMLSMLPQVATQLHMAFGSSALFDNHFNIAHGLKIVAYGVVLLALLLDLVASLPMALPRRQITLAQDPSLPKSKIELMEVGRASRPIGLILPMAAFVLTLLVAGIVGMTFYLESERLVFDEEVEELELQSQLVQPLLALLYRESSEDAIFLSQTPPIQGMIAALQRQDTVDYRLWRERLQVIFTQMLLVKNSYLKVRYIGVDNFAKELVSAKRSPHGVMVVPQSRLNKTFASNYTAPSLIQNIGQVYFSKVEFGKSHRQDNRRQLPVMRAGTPVFDPLSGDVFGAIVIDIDFAQFIENLHLSELQNVNYILANADGSYIYSPDRDLLALNKDDTLFVDFPELQAFNESELNERGFSALQGSDGQAYPSFVRRIDLQHFGSENGLLLLMQNRKSSLGEQLAEFRNRSFIMGVAMGFVALALAVLLARRLSNPLLTLTKAVQDYEQSGTVETLPVHSKDEVGVLARSFNNALKRIQDAMAGQQQTNERIQGIFDNAAEAIITMDDTGHIISFNAAAQEMFAYSEEEVLGHNIKMLMPYDYAAKHDEYLANYKRTGIKHIVGIGREIEGMDANGRVIPMHLAVSQVQTDNGRLFTGFIRDISQQKMVEQTLIEAKEKAEEAARYKSEFLASMSHEIRTPMNGILGMLNMLKRGDLNEEQSKQTQLALSSAKSLLTIINDILDFSKVEAGKLDLEYLDFNLPHQLNEFIETIAPRAQEKNLELILDVNQLNYTMVKGDPGRLRQILTNLVGNAIKFTEQGEIVLRAKVQPLDANRLELECSVSDSGIGIPSNKQTQLFDSFTQVDASTTREYGGTGLGLAICKQLVELMSGRISVQSEPGLGSTFTFSIQLQVSAEQSAPLPKVDVHNVEVLIVDDNSTNRLVLGDQLRQWGAQVSEACSGEDALELLENRVAAADQKNFQLAILDMQMPNMDGAQLGQRIRQDNRFDEVKMIMMTSMSNRGDAQYFADIGFSAYFSKPVIFDDLFAALSVVLEDGAALQQASPLVTHHYLGSLQSEAEQFTQFDDSLRVLLVEDNQINQLVALELLQDMNISCDIANNGLEALQRLKDQPGYQLILMDCQMPELDGYETSRRIRQGQGGHEQVIIIAMTANAMKGDKEKCLAAGMNDYLSKPIDPQVLHSKLLQWVG